MLTTSLNFDKITSNTPQICFYAITSKVQQYLPIRANKISQTLDCHVVSLLAMTGVVAITKRCYCDHSEAVKKFCKDRRAAITKRCHCDGSEVIKKFCKGRRVAIIKCCHCESSEVIKKPCKGRRVAIIKPCHCERSEAIQKL